MTTKIKIAVLDDYQNVARTFADWTDIEKQAEVTFFHEHWTDQVMVIDRLKPFTIVCVMRERTPLTSAILSQLPELKLIVSTGMRNASIDMATAEKHGIEVRHTGYLDTGAPEMTWALLMALAKHIPNEAANIRNGQWQTTIGSDLSGKTIGIVGLGRVGAKMARYAKAFDMKVIAWSENLTEERAHRAGAELVSKERLFREADFITVHLVLSDRTRGIVDQSSLALMKPTAYFINTSRGPLVNERALIEVLQDKAIAGAALDVYDIEPLPADHPIRTTRNLLATPHIGYVTDDTYRLFYRDTVKAILGWL